MSAVEGVVLGHGIAVEPGESPQRIAVGDSFGQFTVVPILHTHQDQRKDRLLGSQSSTSGLRFLQTVIELLTDGLHQSSIPCYESQDLFQHRIKVNALADELQIGEADLRIGGSHAGSFTELPAKKGPLGMAIQTRIGQNLRRDERAIHREQDSENQTTDRVAGRHTSWRPIAAVQRLRQSDVPVQSDAASQARSLLSNQLHLERQEQIAVCPRRRCRGGQPPVGELSSTARTGR